MAEISEQLIEFKQETDDLDELDIDQSLIIKTLDNGGGKYYVIETVRWAFDSLKELTDLFNNLSVEDKN